LLRFAAGQGFAVRRVASVADAFPVKTSPTKASSAKSSPAKSSPRKAPNKKAVPPDPTPLERALALLAKLPKRNRPAKRASLLTFLRSHMAKHVEPARVDALVDDLIASGRISEVGGKLTFDL
jgi:hypothetical protein